MPAVMREPKTYFVYIMTNRSKTLYTGITNSLIRRVREHKLGVGSDFTLRYKLDRLVYFERFEDVHRAIGREKEIKGWVRVKKIALIVSVNPAWRDLSLEWYERHQFQPDPAPVQDNPSGQMSSCAQRRIYATAGEYIDPSPRKAAAQDDNADDNAFWGNRSHLLRQPLIPQGIQLNGRTAARFPLASLSGEGSEGGLPRCLPVQSSKRRSDSISQISIN